MRHTQRIHRLHRSRLLNLLALAELALLATSAVAYGCGLWFLGGLALTAACCLWAAQD